MTLHYRQCESLTVIAEPKHPSAGRYSNIPVQGLKPWLNHKNILTKLNIRPGRARKWRQVSGAAGAQGLKGKEAEWGFSLVFRLSSGFRGFRALGLRAGFKVLSLQSGLRV